MSAPEYPSVGPSLTQILQCSFYNCSSLKKITFPSSLKFIGQSAFANCSSLTEVSCELFSSIEHADISAFDDCLSLKEKPKFPRKYCYYYY